ncbi:MAG: cytochrome P450 [Actinobacteria bacterium]|nr:cytochrome P450 [Actinomycetota bacterium]
MGDHQPVTDWTTDFDPTDDVWAADPYPIWEELRESCPIAHTDRYGGAWLPTRFDDVAAISYDTERFTSRNVIMSEFRPPVQFAPEGIAPPITSDPPYHQDARRMLLPIFSPQAINRLEPATRAYCEELVDAVRGHDVVDAAEQYAQHIPVRVIAEMLGLPESDADIFRGFVNHVIEGVALPLEQRAEGMVELFQYLLAHIEDHVANPRDDLITFLLESELHGEKLEPFDVARTIALLLIAGIDTTWSAIGAALWHLAGTPADRERLVAEPQLLPTAMEELLRAYAPVTMARLVKEDMEWNGCPMKVNDWVLLPFPSANRDPDAFDRPDDVIIDRQVNRHATFGLGIHRCLGSHLARMELRVALEVWLEAFPTFDLADPAAVRWSAGQVRGPRTLPIRVIDRRHTS